MLENVSDKGRYLVVERDNVCLISGISRTVARDDCCAGVTIKWNTHHSRLDFLYDIE